MVFLPRFFKNSSTNSLMRYYLNNFEGKCLSALQKSGEYNWYKSYLSCINQSYTDFFDKLVGYNKADIVVNWYKILKIDDSMDFIKKALFKVNDKICKKRKKKSRKKIMKSLLYSECHFSSKQFKIAPLTINDHSPIANVAGLNCSNEETSIMTRSYRDVLMKSSVVNFEEPNLKDELKNIRYDIDTPYGKWIKGSWLDDRAKKGTTIKVLSYNILAQYLLEMHFDLYAKHDKRYLSWEYRSQALIKEIIDFDADILCLQEVETSQLNFFDMNLDRLGYTGVFKKRTNEKEDGCAIYYRKEKFDLKELVTVEYHQPSIQLLNRDNIGIIIRLCPKDNQQTNLVVATTHLLFNPKRQDIKLAQMQIMLAEVDRVAFKGMCRNGKIRYHPIILTGDFNLKPFTCVYNLLVDGRMDTTNLKTIPPYLGISSNCQHYDLSNMRSGRRLGTSDVEFIKLYNSERRNSNVGGDYPPWRIRNNYDHYGPCTLYHRLNLDSVYPHTHPNAMNATTFQNAWCNVDYIFYGPRKVIDGRREDDELKLISYLRLPLIKEASILKAIPNEVCSSDHLPLLATFHLPIDLHPQKYRRC